VRDDAGKGEASEYCRLLAQSGSVDAVGGSGDVVQFEVVWFLVLE
jgi:hypothetical protein